MWEKRGREAGFPRWQKAGEKGKNYATLHKILQSKKCKEAGANKYRAGTGIKGYEKWITDGAWGILCIFFPGFNKMQ